MKADPKDQQRLLDLQAIDTTLQQLAHRRRTLPELAELDALTKVVSRLEDERVRAEVDVDDLDRDITKLEREVDTVRQRRAKDQQRLDDGRLPARELSALEHEIASLTRRQSELEDAELELMEKRESAQSVLDGVDERIGVARDTRIATEQRRDKTVAEIDKEAQWKQTARGPLAADLPAELVQLYDKIREQSGGLGAALVQHGRCGGCRLELFGADRNRVKTAAPDEVVRCEECRRIMVRTHESGL
ncbi:C4-type zinc ribbon domain-containing protein [Catellatospora sp. KI3]|uniref:zinc ribbon domain-containing protein n=1 Tax=Catellatospora sp. KI3 TaxID=3041620 RepID=UPI002482BC6F|nr:C4-type zinc ribbon domain-containing protein [Catellatospora sp. KI3]MDI1459563.1 C4-type zinc ribbon domain-containing protein [Catellatospora sp. KI3]